MEILARHPRKGDCTIREVAPTYGRVKVLVDYPDLGLCRRPEYLDELVDRGTGGRISLTAPPQLPVPATINHSSPPSWQAARQMLLALRLGQSTFDSIKELSVGMEDVEAACQWAIQRAQSGQISFLLFESPYGMGKSHALGFLKLTAQKAGMASGSVVLDGVSVSLGLPMSLIGSLAHAVEYPETDNAATEGLSQRLAGLVMHGAVDKLRVVCADYLHGCLENLRPHHIENPDLWEVVEDYLCLEMSANQASQRLGVRMQALRARFLEDRPARCADLLREWAQACTVTGARGGLAVLLDEADVDYAQGGRGIIEQGQRTALLEALRQHADTGAKAGSYSRLVVAMAITPGASKPDPIEALKVELGSHLRVVRLRELKSGELLELGNLVVKVYRRAYEIGDDEAKSENVVNECLQATEREAEGRNPRKFIRLLLEKLDVLHA
jgi:hypothetical protein